LKYLLILRPKHWVKNLFVFAAPFFGGTLLHSRTLLLALPVFMTFSLCASSAYVFNDVLDLENDKHHPKKSRRPVALGTMSRRNALLLAGVLAVTASFVAYKIAPAYLYYVLLYLSIQIVYSVRLKNIPIVDIFCIASGFVIRVLGGGAVFQVAISHWLFLTMFMISLVLGAGKRLGEVNLLNEKAGNHRKSLNIHAVSALSEILVISSASALVAYTLYVVDQFQNLIYTVPIVTFGLFRYLLLSKGGLGDPTDALTKDRWLAVTVVVWLLLVGLIRYN
jgi:decaprenyl-phosphate phosphoribosyltransferase